MADTRLMYGATESTPQALLAQPPVVPKSVVQAAAPHIAEFVGTFVLVFAVGCCWLSPSDPAWSSTAVACVYMVMVYATTPVSGGNLNPAVSLALGLVGSLPWTVVLGYWAMQLAGGVVAGMCSCALFNPRKVHLQPVAPFAWEFAAGAELLYTCLLCLSVLCCRVPKRNNPPDDANQFYGLAIGFALAAGGYAAGGVSFACFNPAVALGLDASATPESERRFSGWSLCWIAFEMLGAGLAAALFRVIRVRDVPEGAPPELAEPVPSKKCFCEFVGTFFVVLTVGLNVVLASPATPWSAAAALMCLGYSLGHISGGYFNPAVTLAVCLRGRCSPGLAAAFAASQLLGGVAAGCVVGAYHAAGPYRGVTYALGPGAGYSDFPAVAGSCELAFTFLVAYVFLACCTLSSPASWRTQRNNYHALAVAGAYASGGFASAAVSGGELNPAVCAGTLVASWLHHGPAPPPAPVGNGLAYTFWELAGGLLAAAAFRRTHPAEFRGAPLLGK